MVIIITERVPASLRGELTRWFVEPRTGVFIGKISAMVRDRLWRRVCDEMRGGAAMIIWTTNNEQGFQIEYWGVTSRTVTDWEGLQLVTIPHKPETKKYIKRKRGFFDR